jgi:hypothetical protein
MLQTLVNLTSEQAEACMGTVGISFTVNGGDEAKSIKKQDTPPTGKALTPLVKVLKLSKTRIQQLQKLL